MQVCTVGELKKFLELYRDDLPINVTVEGILHQIVEGFEGKRVFLNGQKGVEVFDFLWLDVQK